MSADLEVLIYLLAGVLFIFSIRGLASPDTARLGNLIGIVGMVIACVVTLFLSKSTDLLSWGLIALGVATGALIGGYMAVKMPMTGMPQAVALFNSFVGLAAVFVSIAGYYAPAAYGIAEADGSISVLNLVLLGLSVFIGAVTFTGSVVAAAKLQGVMTSAPIVFPGQRLLNLALLLASAGLIAWLGAAPSAPLVWLLTILTLVVGIMIVIPIGGADMPVVISMLNSYSGLASVPVGFSLQNPALIITGALVGASGAILSYIMCKAMNRSFLNVILGGFGAVADAAASAATANLPINRGSAEDAAFIMKNAGYVIIVPGYGMAVAQAQHIVREMAQALKKMGVKVAYAIHPVAGRMPGHMNVLLAEAGVDYDEVFALEDINTEFAQADVAYVIGANDVTNPAAKTNPASPIYGMPVLDVEKAKTVLFVKRSMAAGYTGVENELFYRPNTMMLFGDAKKMTEEIVKAL